ATRAAVLRTIAVDQGCSTSELARRIGVSVSNASKHAQVLNHAGLITSTRHANLVLHQLNDLGAGLLRHYRAQCPAG
ncbi:ArsR/SmtB family transcription factor, partial [Streptosporangium minutum]